MTSLLLLLGAAFGPQGVSLVSPAVLSFVDPAVPVALAALGVLAGLDIGSSRPGDRRLLAAASLESGLTMLVVSVGVLLVVPWASATVPSSLLALAAGISAATSLTMPAGSPAEPDTTGLRVIDFGVLLPIVAGALMLAVSREGSLLEASSVTVQACIVALAIAAAGWLLLTRASSETEQRVFGVATLLLLGGAADYLSLSALLAGLVAGMSWQAAGGQAREYIRRDVMYIQHPLLVLVLLVAGARVELTVGALGLATAYVLLRTAGKLAGSFMVRRVVTEKAPSHLGFHLLSPGIFGAAFALNALRALGPDMSLALTITVVGTIASELVARLARPQEVAE